MAKDAYDVAALIGSRICHDLINPLGAISNGVELLGMGDLKDRDEISLISDSVSHANARIKFFRIAFGAADHSTRIGPSELSSILDDLSQVMRTEIIWLIPGDIGRDAAKLFFLLIMCLESAMPYGGQIRVAQEDRDLRITGRADKLKVDPDLWKLLTVPGHWATAHQMQLAPAQVQFLLAADMLSNRNSSPVLDISETAIDVVF